MDVAAEIEFLRSVYSDVQVYSSGVCVRIRGSDGLLAVSMHLPDGYPERCSLTCACRFEQPTCDKVQFLRTLQNEANHLAVEFIGMPVMQIIVEHCAGVINRQDSIEFSDGEVEGGCNSAVPSSSEISEANAAFRVPYDCWTEVSLFLGPRYTSLCVATLNRWLHYIVTDDDLWRIFFIKYAPITNFWDDSHPYRTRRKKRWELEMAAQPSDMTRFRWIFGPAKMPSELPAPWSLSWSYRILAMEQRSQFYSSPSYRNASMMNNDEAAVVVDAIEREMQSVAVYAWKDLYSSTSNPLAQEWAHIQCNFIARMGNTALKLVENFPFSAVPKRLAKTLGIPKTPEAINAFVSQVRYRSLDTDEWKEHDVVEGIVFIKDRDLRLAAPCPQPPNAQLTEDTEALPQPTKDDVVGVRRVPRSEYREMCRNLRFTGQEPKHIPRGRLPKWLGREEEGCNENTNETNSK